MPSIQIANPHGFCAGVARALAIATKALQSGESVWCLHAIVHNTHVVQDLTQRGMRFVENLADIPDESSVLFSAHGVPPSVREEAMRKRLKVIDATCPFVNKVHREVVTYAERGIHVLCIGHPNHAEVVGVTGEAPDSITVISTHSDAERVEVPNPDRVALVTQTTISTHLADSIVAILRRRFPNLQEPKVADICTATRERQDAVARLAQTTDFVIVLGSATSSNSQRLAECARAQGVPAVLIDTLEQLDNLEFPERIGITSGASTPEAFLEAAQRRIESLVKE